MVSFPGKEGRQVKKGDPLVRLNARELELERKGRIAERERIDILHGRVTGGDASAE